LLENEDFSSDKQQYPAHDADIRIQLAQQQLGHRAALFSLAAAGAVIMYMVFVIFLFANRDSMTHEALIAMGVLALMPTALVLGLMRFVFRKEKERDDSSHLDVSPLVTLIREVLEVAKELWPGTKG
jgi:carbon starvation protein CstA